MCSHLGVFGVHRFIKDDYLQQNSFTKYDRYCPFYKSVEMMRNIATFHRLATAAVERTAGGNAEVRPCSLLQIHPFLLYGGAALPVLVSTLCMHNQS